MSAATRARRAGSFPRSHSTRARMGGRDSPPSGSQAASGSVYARAADPPARGTPKAHVHRSYTFSQVKRPSTGSSTGAGTSFIPDKASKRTPLVPLSRRTHLSRRAGGDLSAGQAPAAGPVGGGAG